MSQELIAHAAVKSKEGQIFTGKCHADCFYKMYEEKIKASTKPLDQGFVTNKGRYLNRYEAFELARDNGQLANYDVEEDGVVLFSEHIWSPQFREDPYNYSEEQGYYK